MNRKVRYGGALVESHPYAKFGGVLIDLLPMPVAALAQYPFDGWQNAWFPWSEDPTKWNAGGTTGLVINPSDTMPGEGGGALTRLTVDASNGYHRRVAELPAIPDNASFDLYAEVYMPATNGMSQVNVELTNRAGSTGNSGIFNVGGNYATNGAIARFSSGIQRLSYLNRSVGAGANAAKITFSLRPGSNNYYQGDGLLNLFIGKVHVVPAGATPPYRKTTDLLTTADLLGGPSVTLPSAAMRAPHGLVFAGASARLIGLPALTSPYTWTWATKTDVFSVRDDGVCVINGARVAYSTPVPAFWSAGAYQGDLSALYLFTGRQSDQDINTLHAQIAALVNVRPGVAITVGAYVPPTPPPGPTPPGSSGSDFSADFSSDFGTYQPPVAAFTATPTGGLEVLFESQSDPRFEHAWSFGDTLTARDAMSVTHDYRGPGTYTVTLSVYDPTHNISDVTTRTVTV